MLLSDSNRNITIELTHKMGYLHQLHVRLLVAKLKERMAHRKYLV